MPKRFILVPALALDELAAYHQDIVASLHLYFSPSAPTFMERFAGRPLHEVNGELALRLDESDVRSTFVALTSLEAYFRIDFDIRCRERKKDALSVHFRAVKKARKEKVRLDEDILEGWKTHGAISATLISQLRGAFKFRHWLAHGRYWTPKHGRKYDFGYIHLVAESIISGFPFLA
jgi:hypothetical protein